MSSAIASQEADDDAANLDLVRGGDDGFDALVRRHEVNAAAPAIEALHRRLATHQGDDRGTVRSIGPRLDHDDVPIENAVPDHRIAHDAKGERFALAEQVFRKCQGLGRLHWLDRATRSHATEQRDAGAARRSRALEYLE